ncbi:Uncharacterised protein [Clostridium tertium]|uniref:DUF4440 domain-containing protein n=1 Tax=Clostridium tertium TaxID=1559 RepID=A0A6N3EDB5_9CLOT
MLEKTILNLEKQLLDPVVRKTPEKLREFLSEDFIEFCSSGTIYRYNPNDTFFEENVSFKIMNFTCAELTEGYALATYKVDKIYEKENTIKSSIRSSIWKLIDSKWKMIFHQGTLIK